MLPAQHDDVYGITRSNDVHGIHMAVARLEIAGWYERNEAAGRAGLAKDAAALCPHRHLAAIATMGARHGGRHQTHEERAE